VGNIVRSVEENGLMLGLFSACDYKTLNCTFDASDRFLLYTDGLIEAPNAVGEEFGSERVQNFLASHGYAPRFQSPSEQNARTPAVSCSWDTRSGPPPAPNGSIMRTGFVG
jgi:hypothetical protein